MVASSLYAPHFNLVYQQAKNIVNYLRIIHRILAPGGIWINLGMSTRVRSLLSF